jgi:hypothetical protein
MKIKETMFYLGKIYDLVYEDADDFSKLPRDKCNQAYGVCFCDGMVVLGFSRRMKEWSLIGGTIEADETFEAALAREIKEESNMKLIKSWPIGFQRIAKTSFYQLRYACIVEPYGPFKADPAATSYNGVDRITLIDPTEFNKYIKWGKVGDRLIGRALEKLIN